MGRAANGKPGPVPSKAAQASEAPLPQFKAELEETPVPPKYNVAVVEAVILEVAAELDPEHLSSAEALLSKVVGDPDDAREVEVGAQAIQGLKEVGLIERTDQRVALTPAALRAVELLASGRGAEMAGAVR